MNTRVLRMCERHPFMPGFRQVRNLGQLQPVQFTIREGLVRFSSEAIGDRYGQKRPCWQHLNFKHHRAEIKKTFADLEACAALELDTDAHALWKTLKEQGVYA